MRIPRLRFCRSPARVRRLRIVRVAIKPTAENGLKKPSQIKVDKVSTIPREKIGKRLGVLDDASILAVNRSLAVFLGSCDLGRHPPRGDIPFPSLRCSQRGSQLKIAFLLYRLRAGVRRLRSTTKHNPTQVNKRIDAEGSGTDAAVRIRMSSAAVLVPK